MQGITWCGGGRLVVMLAAHGGAVGEEVGGEVIGAEVTMEEEKDRDGRWRKRLRYAGFFAYYALRFLVSQWSKSTLIYTGWKKDILSLLGTSLGLWFKREESQSLAHDLQKLNNYRLVGLTFLGWHYGGYKGNQPTRITLWCSTMLGYHNSVWFVQFGWEMKH